MLQVGSNDVEDAITEDEAVGEAALVAHSRNAEVLALGNTLAFHLRDIFEERGASEADQEHLEHVHVAIFVVYIFEAFISHVELECAYPLRHFVSETLL